MFRIDLQKRIFNETILRLDQTSITPKEIQLFLPSFLQQHPELNALSVSTLFIGDAGAEIIATILKEHPNITTLDADNNNISCKGAIELAAVKSLVRLNLNRNNVNLAGVQALAASNHFTYLDLTMNPTCRVLHAEALASCTSLIQLRIHFSDDNPQGDEFAKALSASVSIESLEISHSNIGDEGAIALAAMPNLIELIAHSNHIAYRGIEALIASTTLQRLLIGNNKLDDQCAKLLALSNLTHLHVSSNPITVTGMRALASNVNILKLQMECLNIDRNSLYTILSISDPIAIANMGRQQNLPTSVPSLQRLSMFIVRTYNLDKTKLPGNIQEHLKRQ